MKRKKHIAWLLLVINIIMLAAAVVPHHHHQEVLCLQKDAGDCTPDSSRSHQDKNKECKACCVTKGFCFVQQPDANQMPPVHLSSVILFTLADMLNLLPPEEEIHLRPFIYQESLHAICFLSSVGLRAPPADLLS